MHQDNMSAMALIKRGGPASEKSRHIAIRHFWVKKRVDAGEAVVRHLPTAQMFCCNTCFTRVRMCYQS